MPRSIDAGSGSFSKDLCHSCSIIRLKKKKKPNTLNHCFCLPTLSQQSKTLFSGNAKHRDTTESDPISMIIFYLKIICFLFCNPFLLSLQLRITVWSLCTKAVSYIRYPKACQKGKREISIILCGFPVRSTRVPRCVQWIILCSLLLRGDPGWMARPWSLSADSCAPLQ